MNCHMKANTKTQRKATLIEKEKPTGERNADLDAEKRKWKVRLRSAIHPVVPSLGGMPMESREALLQGSYLRQHGSRLTMRRF